MTTRAEQAAARARAKARSQAAFFAHIRRTYSRPDAPFGKREYLALYFAQGGACYACRKATGRGRRLGVDHNHLTGEVRGLVCTGSLDAKTCNRLIAIHSWQMFVRALEILGYEVTLTPQGPPARRVLVPLRNGETTLPYLYQEGTFDLSEVEGIES